jgi:hypothetical protein
VTISLSSAARHIRVSLAASAIKEVCTPSRSICEIDVSPFVEQMERDLRAVNTDPIRRMEILAILRRWQYDEMLDEGSQHTVRILLQKFGPDD